MNAIELSPPRSSYSKGKASGPRCRGEPAAGERVGAAAVGSQEGDAQLRAGELDGGEGEAVAGVGEGGGLEGTGSRRVVVAGPGAVRVGAGPRREGGWENDGPGDGSGGGVVCAVGGGEGGAGGVGDADGVDGGDAVVPRDGGGEAGVGVGDGVGGRVGGEVGDEPGPPRAAVLGDLDPVAGEGGAAVVGGGLPLQVDPRVPVGVSGQAGGGRGRVERRKADIDRVADGPGEAVVVEVDSAILSAVVVAEDEGPGAELQGEDTAGEGVVGGIYVPLGPPEHDKEAVAGVADKNPPESFPVVGEVVAGREGALLPAHRP